MRRFATTVLAAFVLGALALSGCSGGALDSADGKGVVRAIHRAPPLPRVVIEHGDMPGFMNAMTMGYAIDDPALLAGIETGQTVEFHAVHVDGKYKVTEIHAVAEDEDPA